MHFRISNKFWKKSFCWIFFYTFYRESYVFLNSFLIFLLSIISWIQKYKNKIWKPRGSYHFFYFKKNFLQKKKICFLNLFKLSNKVDEYEYITFDDYDN